MPGGLRTARHCVFTGGVVEENSICRADFLRKQPRGGKNPLRLTAFASSPFGGAGTAQAVTERVPSPFCEKNYRIWQSRQAKTGKSAPVLTLTN